MILHFDIIPHKRQRYDTVGDYYTKDGATVFRISRIKDKRYCWLVWLHEVIEWSICRLSKIETRKIDQWDCIYEALRRDGRERAPCGCKLQDEPGDDIHAPYHEAHQVASQCERLIAKALGVDWVKYDEAVMRL